MNTGLSVCLPPPLPPPHIPTSPPTNVLFRVSVCISCQGSVAFMCHIKRATTRGLRTAMKDDEEHSSVALFSQKGLLGYQTSSRDTLVTDGEAVYT